MALPPIHLVPTPAMGFSPSEGNPRQIELDYLDRLTYAQDQQRQGNIPVALAIFSQLAEPHETHTESHIPETVRQQAEEYRNAILGSDGFTATRAEFLTQNLMGQVFDPVGLGAMVGAGLTYKIARFGLMRSAARLGLRYRWVQPASGVLAFGAEAFSFPLHSRMLAQGMGRAVDWSSPQLMHDIQSSFLILGGLRLARGTGHRLFDGIHGSRGTSGLSTSLTPNMFRSRMAFENGSLFAGIVLGHRLEQSFGLQADQGTLQLLAESLITFTHLKSAERIIPRLTGNGFRQWERQLEWHTRSLEFPSPRAAAEPWLPTSNMAGLPGTWALAMASNGNPNGLRSGRPLHHGENVGSNLVFSMKATGGNGPTAATPELSRLIRELDPVGRGLASDLLAPNATQFHQTLRELAAQNIGREEANRQLAEILQADWIQRMVEIGVRIDRVPMVEYFRAKITGGAEPAWLTRIAEDSTTRDLEMIEIFADAQAHRNAESEQHGDSLGSFAFATGVMDAIAMRLKLPGGTFLEVLSQDPQEFRTYIPPVPFFLKISEAAYGDRVLDYELTPELSTSVEVRDLLSTHRRPWLVSDRFVGLHEFDRAHPYAAWAHDAFHILDLSQIAVSTRQALPLLFDYFSEMTPRSEAERSLQQKVLPNLLEGEYVNYDTHIALFHEIAAANISPDSRDRIKKDLEEIIAVTER